MPRISAFAACPIAAVLAFGLAACSAERGASIPPSGGATQAQAHQRVRHTITRQTKDVVGGSAGFTMTPGMTDAPLAGATGAGAQFNVGILGVDAIAENGDSWQLLANATPQVVNLLSLQTTTLVLGTGVLPAGTYPGLQLLLDPATTSVTLNGQSYPVHFVSPEHPWWDATQTIESVEVPLHVTGQNGQSVTATIDFNVFQSANLVGGVVYLTPTIAAGFGAAAIHGTVANAAGAPVANATIVATAADGSIANVSVTGADGTFTVHGINPGGYTLSVLNSYTTAAGATVTAVGADAGASPTTYSVVGDHDSVSVGTLKD